MHEWGNEFFTLICATFVHWAVHLNLWTFRLHEAQGKKGAWASGKGFKTHRRPISIKMIEKTTQKANTEKLRNSSQGVGKRGWAGIEGLGKIWIKEVKSNPTAEIGGTGGRWGIAADVTREWLLVPAQACAEGRQGSWARLCRGPV